MRTMNVKVPVIEYPAVAYPYAYPYNYPWYAYSAWPWYGYYVYPW